VVWLCGLCITNGQQGDSQKERYVVLPADQGLLAIAYQPDCPLQFENAKLLRKVNGPWAQTFSLTNRGTKAIRAFSIGTSTGSEWTWEAIDPDHYIVPQQTVPDRERLKVETLPLTDELRDSLNIRGRMKGVVVLMVARVKYADGTTYDAQSAFTAMQEYFEEVYLRMDNEKPKAGANKLTP